MHRLLFAVLVVGVSLTLGCGEETDTAPKPGGDQRDDRVAFVAPGSNSVLQMNTDGTNVQPFTGRKKAPEVWPDQQRILNSVCDPSFGDQLDDPIKLVSPDGASLGPLDDSWAPDWSPDGDFAAVACGRDDDGLVVVVGDVEIPGTRNGWSRNGPGTLSDRMEILIIKADGSSVTQRTRNEAGDWLPRWDPSGQWLLIETNRLGNSEIYLLDVDTTGLRNLSARNADDQTPAWSRNGATAAFARNVNGEFEVHVVPVEDGAPSMDGLLPIGPTGQTGRPVPWPGQE